MLIPEPCYISYQACTRFAGGVPVQVHTHAKNDFELDAGDLEAAITEKSKVLLLSYPSNPTGAVLPREKLEAVARVAIKHDLFVICDEIYSELTYDGFTQTSMAALPGMWERTMTISGFSKAFAMTGFRLGYLCAPQPHGGCRQDPSIHHHVRQPAKPGGRLLCLKARARDRL